MTLSAQAERFSLQLEEHFQALRPLSTPQKTWRDKAWKRFLELGLPSREKEAFQYLPLSLLYQERFNLPSKELPSSKMIDAATLPECRGCLLTFINGRYTPALSNLKNLSPKVVILPIREALGPYGQFLQGRLLRNLQEEKDSFALLNGAFFDQSLFVYIPPHLVLDKPIQCLFYTTESGVLSAPRLQFFVGSGAQVEWISSVQGERGFCTSLTDLVLEEGAHLRYYPLFYTESKNWHFESLRGTLKRDTLFKMIAHNKGGHTIRHDIQLSLVGENAHADLKGLTELSGSDQAHTRVQMEHAAPHTGSEQLFKAVVKEAAQTSFEGKILVQPVAQKTEAYQLSNNLIMGERAQANCKPNLEIFADDVKASHGATVTQIDESLIFYLKARGLSEEKANEFLISAFSREILSEILFKIC